MGRPTIITKDTLEKLEYGFMCGLTDDEACLYAKINPGTLYNYMKKNEDYGSRKELLKKQPNIKAKFNLIKGLDEGDKNDSKWWLERKSRNEFSLKTEIDQNLKVEGNIDLNDKTPKELEELRKNYL